MDFVVRTEGQWSLAEDWPPGARGRPREREDEPLTREERVEYAQEIGDWREACREACSLHLEDLWGAYPGGPPRSGLLIG